eukprot:7076327-Pyramimonas_sp.AAC.1
MQESAGKLAQQGRETYRPVVLRRSEIPSFRRHTNCNLLQTSRHAPARLDRVVAKKKEGIADLLGPA